MWIDKYLKAIIGGLIAGLSLLAGFLSAPDATFQSITAGQWVGVAIAFLFGLTGVYATPNGMQPPKQVPIWVGTEEDDVYAGTSWGEPDATLTADGWEDTQRNTTNTGL